MALFIMFVIAVIAFATVVAVMYVGSVEDNHLEGGEASASKAVDQWTQRANARETAYRTAAQAHNPTANTAVPASETVGAQASPSAAPIDAGKSTGQSITDLSESDKEEKRRKALERRKARAAKRAAQSDS